MTTTVFPVATKVCNISNNFFLLLIFKVFKKIPSEKNNINKLVLIGSILLIIFQVLIHVGVNIRFLPTTGMTLPFLSYGGSSLISSAIVAGIILNYTKNKTYLYE